MECGIMKKIFYPAVFTKEENGYWVKFPDLPGCFTEGDSISEAYEMAQHIVYSLYEGKLPSVWDVFS